MDVAPVAAWDLAAALPDRPNPHDLMRLRATLPDVPKGQWNEVVTQTLLRRKAEATLGPGPWWLTEAGLQQASRPTVAVRRSRQLVEQGMTRFVDLGCGLGIDSLAAAREGLAVTAVERDDRTAAYAARNLAHFAPTGHDVQVVRGDALEQVVPRGSVAFVDPARRSGTQRDGSSHRTLAPQDWAPPWSWLAGFAAAHPHTLAKVAPGIDRDLPPPGVAIEWVSVAGALVEATLWFPGVRGDRPRRTATLLSPMPDPWQPGSEHRLSGTGEPAAVGVLGDWLLEPDAAVIRSGLVGDLASLIGGRTISDGIAYLTTDAPPPTHWGRVSRIEAVVATRPKALRAELRQRGFGSVEIRTRGLGLDPAVLRRQLALRGDGPSASLVLTRVAGSATGLLVSDHAVPGGRK